MKDAELVVVILGIAVTAALAWYFFAPRTAVRAQLEGGRQVVDITVHGGYSPTSSGAWPAVRSDCDSTGRRTPTAGRAR